MPPDFSDYSVVFNRGADAISIYCTYCFPFKNRTRMPLVFIVLIVFLLEETADAIIVELWSLSPRSRWFFCQNVIF